LILFWITPFPEISYITLIAQLYRPRLRCPHHRIIDADRK
jgi:hypothetical protein